MIAYLHLTFVYFNGAKLSFQFRVTKDTPLSDLISKLNTLLRYSKNRRVVKFEYRSSSFDSKGKMHFTNFELKTNEDLNIKWSTFHCYASKCLIEMDAKIARFIKYIINMLQRLKLPVYNDI